MTKTICIIAGIISLAALAAAAVAFFLLKKTDLADGVFDGLDDEI